jgi:hypothetical protein
MILFFGYINHMKSSFCEPDRRKRLWHMFIFYFYVPPVVSLAILFDNPSSIKNIEGLVCYVFCFFPSLKLILVFI